MIQMSQQQGYGIFLHRHSKTGRVRLFLFGSVAISLLSGCTPSWQIRPGNRGEAPTVASVLKNVNSQIACALKFDKESFLQATQETTDAERKQERVVTQDAWDRFLSSHAVAAVALTLQVNQTEGLNPSVSFITPYAPVKPSTTSTTQGVWNLGVQLNGMQQRQLIINYVLDVDQLEKATSGNSEIPKDYQIQCAPPPMRRPSQQTGLFDRELQGDLGLDETIEAQLVGLELARSYGIPSGTQGLASLKSLPGTSFSAQVSFTVGEGINGGPNWKLLRFQGPSGGGGGGSSGSGSGGSSGGGGSSSGGGGGQQLLNFNRTTLDQLQITFTPTCGKGTNWDFQSTCASGEAIAALKSAVSDAEHAEVSAEKEVKALQERRSHLFALNTRPSEAEIRATQSLAEATRRRVEAQTRLNEEISSTSAKAAAASFGATQNLLNRLNLGLSNQLQ